MVMFSLYSYQDIFCTSPVIHFTVEATVLIIDMLVGHFIPPFEANYARISTPQFPSVIVSQELLRIIPHIIHYLSVLPQCDWCSQITVSYL